MQHFNNQFSSRKCNCAEKTARGVNLFGGLPIEQDQRNGRHFSQQPASMRFPQQFPAARYDILQPGSSGGQGTFGGDPTGILPPLKPPPIRPNYFDSAGGVDNAFGSNRM